MNVAFKVKLKLTVFDLYDMSVTALLILSSFSVPNLKFSFNRSRDIRGSQNSKYGSRDPDMTPFDPILHFLSLEHTAFRLRDRFEVASFNNLRDIRGSQNYKIGSRDPHMTPFDLILRFFC